MAHKNVELLKNFDESMGSGDVEKMFSFFSDDVVVHIGGRSKLAGDFKGKQELMEAFGMFMQSVGEDAAFDTHTILADDEHGIMLQALSSKRSDSPGAIPGIGVFHFSGGKISEAWFTDMDPYTADPFYDAGL